jgi:hypothetical protein
MWRYTAGKRLSRRTVFEETLGWKNGKKAWNRLRQPQESIRAKQKKFLFG